MTTVRHKADDAFLDAARGAILAVGWSRTTLTDIARRAGVSRMTLYRRWPDSQTLLADLMTREWTAVVSAATASLEGTARDRITAGVVATVQALRDNDLVRRIVDVDPEVLLPYLLHRRGRSQEYVAASIAGLIAEGQRDAGGDGSVRAGDPTTMARALLLATHGFVLSPHTMSDDRDVTAYDVELTRLVDGYLA